MGLKFGIIGSGSWATALVKILTDNNQHVNWWIRNNDIIQHIQKRKHNPHYLSSAYFDVSLLNLSGDINATIRESDVILIAVPSAYIREVLKAVEPGVLKNKKILSAVKGIVPEVDVLLNEYLLSQFQIPLEDYFALLG